MNYSMRWFIKFFVFFAFLGGDFMPPLCAATSTTRPMKRKKKRSLKKKKRPRKIRTKVRRKIFYPKFSRTLSKFFDHSDDQSPSGSPCIWQGESLIPFDELILSWNALRPASGKITFFVSVKHSDWSPWHRLAEWGADSQKTFVNKLNPYVHTKYVKVEMQRNLFATAFRIKAVFSDGASKRSLNALFACISNMPMFRQNRTVPAKPSLLVKGVPQQSQMVIDHPRAKDLCSPASTSMIVQYFANKLYTGKGPLGMHDYVIDFAGKVHDDGVLGIYGNWPLNVAQAHDASNGHIFYRVERLNSFNELYDYISKEIPVAVSVRRLKGGATPYSKGHFMVVVGWDNITSSVICIDPAFRSNRKTLKRYKLAHFLNAWALSRNLSYIPMPKNGIGQWQENITASLSLKPPAPEADLIPVNLALET